MSTALILVTESLGCEHTGDAPGDSVLMKSEQLRRMEEHGGTMNEPIRLYYKST
jgi:hypothetical protein